MKGEGWSVGRGGGGGGEGEMVEHLSSIGRTGSTARGRGRGARFDRRVVEQRGKRGWVHRENSTKSSGCGDVETG